MLNWTWYDLVSFVCVLILSKIYAHEMGTIPTFGPYPIYNITDKVS